MGTKRANELSPFFFLSVFSVYLSFFLCYTDFRRPRRRIGGKSRFGGMIRNRCRGPRFGRRDDMKLNGIESENDLSWVKKENIRIGKEWHGMKEDIEWIIDGVMIGYKGGLLLDLLDDEKYFYLLALLSPKKGKRMYG